MSRRIWRYKKILTNYSQPKQKNIYPRISIKQSLLYQVSIKRKRDSSIQVTVGKSERIMICLTKRNRYGAFVSIMRERACNVLWLRTDYMNSKEDYRSISEARFSY